MHKAVTRNKFISLGGVFPDPFLFPPFLLFPLSFPRLQVASDRAGVDHPRIPPPIGGGTGKKALSRCKGGPEKGAIGSVKQYKEPHSDENDGCCSGGCRLKKVARKLKANCCSWGPHYGLRRHWPQKIQLRDLGSAVICRSVGEH